MRAAAKAAAVDEQGFAVGVINSKESPGLRRCLHQQCVARMIDRTGATAAKAAQTRQPMRRAGQRNPDETARRAITMAAASSTQKASD